MFTPKNVSSAGSPAYQHLQKDFLLAKLPAKSVWNGANEPAGNGAAEREIFHKKSSWCASLSYSPFCVYVQTIQGRTRVSDFYIFGNALLPAYVPVHFCSQVIFWSGLHAGFSWCSFKPTLYLPGELVVGVADCWVWRIGLVCSVQMVSAMRESSSLKISQMVGKKKSFYWLGSQPHAASRLKTLSTSEKTCLSHGDPLRIKFSFESNIFELNCLELFSYPAQDNRTYVLILKELYLKVTSSRKKLLSAQCL